jgi:hypothetical protein
MRTEYRDFPLRMSETLNTLEKAEKRSQLEILNDLFTTATNIEIQGVVIKLKEEVETGKVTMMGCVLGKLRKIYVDLAEPDYNLAIKAYQERIPVICSGDLSKEGEAFVLKNPRTFALQPEEVGDRIQKRSYLLFIQSPSRSFKLIQFGRLCYG